MAIAPYKTFVDGEVILANDMNASFLQITNAGVALVSPLTGTLDADGQEIIFDADADSSITADTDDLFDFRAGGVDIFKVDGRTASSVNGLTVLSSATGNPPQLLAHGSDTNVGIKILPKGTGSILLDADPTGVGVDIDGAPLVLDADADSSLRETSDDVIALKLQGIDAFIFDGDAASAANGLTFRSAANGSDVEIAGQGSSTDVNVKITSKGSGVIKFNSGTLTATPAANAIPIANGSGTLNSWISSDQFACVLLASYSPSAAASVDITSVISATYSSYLITYALIPSADSCTLTIRTDTSNGASFDSGASDYMYANFSNAASTATTYSANRSTAATSMEFSGRHPSTAQALDTDSGGSGWVRLNNLGSATQYPMFTWAGASWSDANGTVNNIGSGARVSYAAINAVQILGSSNLTGSVKVYGLKAA